MWIFVDGPLLGSELGSRAELLAKAGPLLRESLKKQPYLPGVLRVATEELAGQLRGQISSRVEVVVGPTEDLDETAEMVADQLAFPPTYLGEGVDAAMVASFFRATARLYRARPWRQIGDGDWIGVSIPDLAMNNYVLAVAGASRDSHPGGRWRCIPRTSKSSRSSKRWRRNARPGELEDDGEDEVWPALQILTYQNREELPPALLAEVDEHGWETAGPKALPYAASMQEDGDLPDSGEDDYVAGEAISLALLDLLAHERSLRKALSGEGPPLVSRTVVDLQGEKLEVVLTAPYADAGDDEEEAAPEPPRRRSGPAPAERNKTKTAGAPSGSSRRKR